MIDLLETLFIVLAFFGSSYGVVWLLNRFWFSRKNRWFE